MTHRELFDKLMQAFSSVQPHRAPDFSREFVCAYWYSEFSGLSIDVLKISMDKWIQNNGWFPSIAELRRMLGVHEEDPELAARQVVANIMAAIGKFGWMKEIAAKEALSPLSWQVVIGSGGWGTLCDMTCQTQSTMMAQMRELARSLISTSRYPVNEVNRASLQPLAQSALDLVKSSTRCVKEGRSKRIPNPKINPRLPKS